MIIAAIAPATIATGKGTPKFWAMSPAEYAETPQNAACPNESRPTNPSSRSTEIAKSAQAAMSTAIGG